MNYQTKVPKHRVLTYFLPLLAIPLLGVGCPNQNPAQDAADVMGGLDALLAVNTLQTEASGQFFEPQQGFQINELVQTTDFDYALTEDYAQKGAKQTWNLTSIFPFEGAVFNFSEVSLDDIGFIDGENSGFFPEKQSPMFSSRIVARGKQRLLSTPLLLVREAATNLDNIKLLADQEFDGKLHNVIEIPGGIEPIRVFFDPETALPAKAEVKEGDPVFGDVLYEVIYKDYQTVEGIQFPFQVTQRLAGIVLSIETRSQIIINPEVDIATFEVPAEFIIPFDPALALFADQITNLFLRNQAILIPLDLNQGQAPFVVDFSELAPGVFHVTGGSHHNLVIEMSDHLIIVEAPLYEDRTQFVLAEIKARFPGKPIREIILTHHHHDHIGGTRGYAAEPEASLLVPLAGLPLFEQMLEAPHTIYTDALELNPRNIVIEGVSDIVTRTDGVRTVEIFNIPTQHSEGMVGVFLPAEGIVFVSDIFNPGILPPGVTFPPGRALDEATDFFNELVRRGLESQINLIAGGHGFGTNTFDDLRIAVGQ